MCTRSTDVGSDGNQLHFDIAVVSGWSDWVRALKLFR